MNSLSFQEILSFFVAAVLLVMVQSARAEAPRLNLEQPGQIDVGEAFPEIPEAWL